MNVCGDILRVVRRPKAQIATFFAKKPARKDKRLLCM